ncbi:MAG: hypothetical protein K1X85_08670 [Ignavibacteria bacterium]|nr:hypothetical protein [Ignavibacteria bacterium]
MTGRQKLIAIKFVHTAVWLFFNFVIFYMLYAVIVNKIGVLYWICLGLILLEGFTLLAFKMFCPLTVMARKYSDSGRHNFDIYLPEWLAKYTKLIYTSLVVVSIVIMLFRLL